MVVGSIHTRGNYFLIIFRLYLNYFYFPDLVTRQSAALSSATQELNTTQCLENVAVRWQLIICVNSMIPPPIPLYVKKREASFFLLYKHVSG